MRLLAALADPWCWRMAHRDSRRTRGRLLLFASAMTIGIAALVAIQSFAHDVQAAIDLQSKELLGADLRLRSAAPLDAEVEAVIERRLIGELGGELSRQVSFTSMAAFPSNGATHLVQVRALDGPFPFYGTIASEPPEAAATFRAQGGALVDAGLLAQVGVDVGDRIKLGSEELPIAGKLTRIAGESATAGLFGPRVYVPSARLDPELLARGSRVNHDACLRFPAGVDADAVRAELRELANRTRLRLDTPTTARESLQRTLDNLSAFLQLVGFVALLLGALGVASAVHVLVRQKTAAVATLRCIGADGARTFAIYLIQSLLLGLFAGAAGALLGLGVQQLLPAVFADFLPLAIEPAPSPAALLLGLAVGTVVAAAFALLPLLRLRDVPPLLALRSDLEPIARRFDPARMIAIGAIGAIVAGFAAFQTGRLLVGLAYAAGLLLAWGLLLGTGVALQRAARGAAGGIASFAWRFGIANLDRPANQTRLLLVTIGLATFFVLTLFQVRGLLLSQLGTATGGAQPNLVFFDVQDDQIDQLKQRVAAAGVPILEQAPIVAMRLRKINGRTGDELRADPGSRAEGWALRREYRSTYRAEPSAAERIVRGTFSGTAPADPGTPVSISLEEGIANQLGVDVGDRLDWDVQGLPIATVVGSIRAVDWRRFRPNFFAVFPPGVLEEAPQFHVLVLRADDPAVLAELQRDAVARFPNVTAIDVTLVLEVAEELLSRIGFAIHFMAMFSVLTGLLVLVSAVLTSRYQRIEESALLRTLGARRALAARALDAELLALGLLAAATGTALSVAATWALARFRFEADFSPQLPALLIAHAAVPALTLAIGRLANRGVHDAPPLEVLRAAEGGG